MDSVILHSITCGIRVRPKIALSQATSPLRNAEDIRAACDLFDTEAYELVLTVTEADPSVQKYGRLEANSYFLLSSSSHCFVNRKELPPHS